MRTSLFFSAVLTAIVALPQRVIAASGITNPVTGEFGSDVAAAQDGSLFTGFIIFMWNTIITIGALLVLLYFIWGAIDWLTSAGEKGKIETARNKMMHAFIGLFLLVGSYTLIGFISMVLFGTEFNILSPVIILNN